MIRLKVVAEGQTEETFVRTVLAPHLARYDVFATAFCLTTSRRPRRPDLRSKGGLVSYSSMKRQILRLLAEDRKPDMRMTTMVDFYGLPGDFPGVAAAGKISGIYNRVENIEQELARDLGAPQRFLPYIQVHEFEALVLVEPGRLIDDFPGDLKGIDRLAASLAALRPEEIDDGPTTAPSRRIIAQVPTYGSRKREVGPRVVARIGLERLRDECPHFGAWLERLESLAERQPFD